MAPKGPAYVLRDFLGACERMDVFVQKSVLSEASKDFGITSEKDLMVFVVELGEEGLEFKNCNPLEWEGKNKGAPVDAYKFDIDGGRGYLAFFKGHTKNFVFKSLHKDPEYKPATQNLGELFVASGFKLPEKKD